MNRYSASVASHFLGRYYNGDIRLFLIKLAGMAHGWHHNMDIGVFPRPETRDPEIWLTALKNGRFSGKIGVRGRH